MSDNNNINYEEYGFILLENRTVKEINSDFFLFENIKNKAKLIFLKNTDKNRTFSISFRTPPDDDSGLPHIMEHSVLCGSKKFPVKEPFVELAKGSFNTFLNAMTYPDKTVYPVASTNLKDFYNLADVYLDAVFFPKIYEKPEIFMQEGWHYEIDDKTSDLEYNGVVYNEMKGYFSLPENILSAEIMKTMFPETPYYFESGGDPEKITELTYEKFLNFHKRYYHPSNSFIFVYGDLEIKKFLKFINDKYLIHFTECKINSQIPEQKKFSNQISKTVCYPCDENNVEDKYYISLNYVLDNILNPENTLAFNILENILLNTPASPLKNALLKSEIGKDVFGYYDTSSLQPVFSIILKHLNINNKELFKTIVQNIFSELVEKGIDKNLINASLNSIEFKLREADYRGLPKGLVYNLEALDTWLYNGHPLLNIEYEKILENIKKKSHDCYFENLIKKYFLNNKFSSILILEPKKNLNTLKNENLVKKLQSVKDNLTENELQEIKEKNKSLKKFQTTPDSIENLETLPVIKLSDIDKNALKLNLDIIDSNKTIFFHNCFTNGIVYHQIFFNFSNIKEENLKDLMLLTVLLTELSTENYTYQELSNLINSQTGGISFSLNLFTKFNDPDIYNPKLTIKGKVLKNNVQNFYEIIYEIICMTKFNEKKRIKEVIKQLKSRLEMSMIQSGHIIGIQELESCLTQSGAFAGKFKGIDFYNYICDIEKNYDAKFDILIEQLKKICSLIFSKNNISIAITSSEPDFLKSKNEFFKFKSKLPSTEYIEKKYNFELNKINKGIIIPGDVNYVTQGYNFRKAGFNFKSELFVLKNILTYDFLWNNIRVLGGAYGALMKVNNSGSIIFSSYRDPNLSKTLTVYSELTEYLNTLNLTERELRKNIIGTLSNKDRPLTPSMRGEAAIAEYFSDYSYDIIQKQREDILSCSLKKIRELKNLLKEILNKNYYCVVGIEKDINKNKDLFHEVYDIFK